MRIGPPQPQLRALSQLHGILSVAPGLGQPIPTQVSLGQLSQRDNLQLTKSGLPRVDQGAAEQLTCPVLVAPLTHYRATQQRSVHAQVHVAFGC